MRYKRENIALVGLMPGAKLTKSSYLQPLVEERTENTLVQYIHSLCSSSLKKVFKRVALICYMCDIPATRKVCGFVGHNAKRVL